MNREQAKAAYRLAYVTALQLLAEKADKRPRKPYRETAIEKYGLTEEERDKIWKCACEDMWRRHGNWRDEMIRNSEDYAEIYAAIYIAHEPD